MDALSQFVLTAMGAEKMSANISEAAGFPVYRRLDEPFSILIVKDDVVEIYQDPDVFFARYLNKKTPRMPGRG